MSQTVGDFLVQRLDDWGVRHIFGYPGDGIDGVSGALNREDGKIKFIQARHHGSEVRLTSSPSKAIC
jgi:pyruvate dehydrogenase (quinone)